MSEEKKSLPQLEDMSGALASQRARSAFPPAHQDGYLSSFNELMNIDGCEEDSTISDSSASKPSPSSKAVVSDASTTKDES